MLRLQKIKKKLIKESIGKVSPVGHRRAGRLGGLGQTVQNIPRGDFFLIKA